jgi:hypothetical protein
MVDSSSSTITSKLVLVLIYPKSNDTIISYLQEEKKIEGRETFTNTHTQFNSVNWIVINISIIGTSRIKTKSRSFAVNIPMQISI